MAADSPIEKLLEQEVDWTELPEPENKDGLYAVREGVLEIGAAKLRVYVLNDGDRYIDADDVVAFLNLHRCRTVGHEPRVGEDLPRGTEPPEPPRPAVNGSDHRRAFVCRNQSICEKHWPDEWPEGTKGVPEDRIAGRGTDATITACDELELRRRAAEGDQDAVAEMRRRNRIRVGQALADPKAHRAPDRRQPDVGYVSTGRRAGIATGSQVA